MSAADMGLQGIRVVTVQGGWVRGVPPRTTRGEKLKMGHGSAPWVFGAKSPVYPINSVGFVLALR